MDFRKNTQGEAGSTKNVEQVACFYDNSVAKKDGKIAAHYGEVYGHPDTELAAGQTNLALVNQRSVVDGKPQYNHSVPFYPNQVEAIKEAAGDNTAPLLDKDGKRVGTIYGFRSDLMTVQRDGKAVGFMANTKTLQPSELSVAEVGGKDIRARIFDSMAAAKADKAAQAKEAPAVVAEQSAEVEQPAPEVEPELV